MWASPYNVGDVYKLAVEVEPKGQYCQEEKLGKLGRREQYCDRKCKILRGFNRCDLASIDTPLVFPAVSAAGIILMRRSEQFSEYDALQARSARIFRGLPLPIHLRRLPTPRLRRGACFVHSAPSIQCAQPRRRASRLRVLQQCKPRIESEVAGRHRSRSPLLPVGNGSSQSDIRAVQLHYSESRPRRP